MKMVTHCPDCGRKFKYPIPSDHVCGKCIVKKILDGIAEAAKPTKKEKS